MIEGSLRLGPMIDSVIGCSAILFWMIITFLIMAVLSPDEKPNPLKEIRKERDRLKNKIDDMWAYELLGVAFEVMEADKENDKRPWLVVQSDNLCGWRGRYGHGDLSTNADSMALYDISGSDMPCTIEGAINHWGDRDS